MPSTAIDYLAGAPSCQAGHNGAPAQREAHPAGYESDMEHQPRHDEDTPETAEPPEAEELSEKVPDKASGAGDTPLGDTDEHSDAPGPHGTD